MATDENRTGQAASHWYEHPAFVWVAIGIFALAVLMLGSIIGW